MSPGYLVLAAGFAFAWLGLALLTHAFLKWRERGRAL